MAPPLSTEPRVVSARVLGVDMAEVVLRLDGLPDPDHAAVGKVRVMVERDMAGREAAYEVTVHDRLTGEHRSWLVGGDDTHDAMLRVAVAAARRILGLTGLRRVQ